MSQESIKRVIENAAKECETCCRLAAFAEGEYAYGYAREAIAAGLRKLAAYHAQNAFNASLMLPRGSCA